MSNTESTSSLMEIIRRLIGDPQEYAEFKENPTQYVIDHGMDEASPEEISDAFVLACEMPVVSQGAVVNGGNATSTIAPQVGSSTTAPPARPWPGAPISPTADDNPPAPQSVTAR